ncbi:MAG: DUF4197 domain-containing protein [Formivibrio sp.]|nr:DUF4197 domain-containing protein [Formivibrio sp.]
MRILWLVLTLLLAAPAWAQDWSSITNQQASQGAKEALVRGAEAAVSALAKPDGYLGNPSVKIPLPPSLAQVDQVLGRFGMNKMTDELIVRMNRAAEMAVTEARPILLDSIRKMSVADIKNVLTGPDDSLTRYFRQSSGQLIAQRFLPKVKAATAQVQLADVYNQYAGQAAQFGLVKQEDANLDQFVTNKAVDGLFFMIAEQERAIRADPLGQGSRILKTVFGALK